MSEQHPDPGGDGAARAAQVAATVLTITEGLIRLRAQQTANRADADQRQVALSRAVQAEQAAANLNRHPASEQRWLHAQTVGEPGIPLAGPTDERLAPGVQADSRRSAATASPGHRGHRPVRVIVGEAYPVPTDQAVAAAASRPRTTSVVRPAAPSRAEAMRR